MNPHDAQHRHEEEPPRFRLPSSIVFAVLFGVAAFFLLTEHRAHLYGALPFLLLALCPLMHLFHGHGGHGDHARHESHGPDKPVSGS